MSMSRSSASTHLLKTHTNTNQCLMQTLLSSADSKEYSPALAELLPRVRFLECFAFSFPICGGPVGVVRPLFCFLFLCGMGLNKQREL